MKSISFRQFDIDHDLPALAEFLTKVRIQKVTAERVLIWENNVQPDQIRRTTIAQANDNSFAGYSLVYHRPGAADGRLYLDVAVDPAWRKQGVGTALYVDALQYALANDATILDADVYDNCPHCLKFAEERGFAINRHLFESSLDLHAFDPSLFDNIVQSVEANGIRIFSLAEAGDSEEIRRQLYDVNYCVALDDPASHGTFPSYEEFSSFVFTASWYRSEGQILAAEGNKIIGLSAVGYFADTNSMENMITGVLPAYRGRKIGQALKLVALRFAKESGADSIRAHNDSQNEPMLAINRKLGYKSQVGEYRMVLRF